MKHKPLKPMSSKMSTQKVKEKELSQVKIQESEGCCQLCGRFCQFGLNKHEIVFRSHGGSATDPDNTILLCLDCHDRQKINGLLVDDKGRIVKNLLNKVRPSKGFHPFSKETQLRRKVKL